MNHDEMARETIENGIVDCARGLRFTILYEGGARSKYWLEELDHFLKELHRAE